MTSKNLAVGPHYKRNWTCQRHIYDARGRQLPVARPGSRITPPLRAPSRPAREPPPHRARASGLLSLTGVAAWQSSLDPILSARWPRASPYSAPAPAGSPSASPVSEGITYHVHLTAAEAQRFVAYVDERAEA